jgi:hypothetical protein
MVERSKIMFAVRVIVRRERIEASHRVQNRDLIGLSLGHDTFRDHHSALPKGFSRQVIQRCDLTGPSVV